MGWGLSVPPLPMLQPVDFASSPSPTSNLSRTQFSFCVLFFVDEGCGVWGARIARRTPEVDSTSTLSDCGVMHRSSLPSHVLSCELELEEPQNDAFSSL